MDHDDLADSGYVDSYCRTRGVDASSRECRRLTRGCYDLYATAAGVETAMADDAQAKIEEGITSALEVARVMGEA